MNGHDSLALRLAQRLDRRLYYGWVIVGVVFIANIAAFAINPSFGLFVGPLEQEFGWDRGTLARSLTLGTVVGAAVSPLLGALSDRVGVRSLMVACGTVAALCFALLSQVQQAWQYNLLLGTCYGVMTTGIGSVLGSVAVSQWFVRRRGRAMGIVMMGASGSGLVFVLLHSLLLATLGWRAAYLIQGALTLVLIVLPAWFLLIDRPETIGAQDEGGARPAAKAEPAPAAQPASAQPTAVQTTAAQPSVTAREAPPAPAPAAQDEHSWSLADAAKTRAFWVTLAGVMIGSFPVIGYFAHAVPILQSHGLSAGVAASAWATFFVTGILAKFVWGFAIERLSVRYSLAICFAAEAAGLFLLSQASSPLGAFAWAVLNGLGHGPYLQLLAMVWADYFGRRSLGAIFGTVQPFIVFSASLGPWVAGLLYDAGGSYDLFLRIAIGMTVVAGAIFLLDPPPRIGKEA